MPRITQQEEPQFDWELFGTIVRKARIKKGYKKAEAFCNSIYRRSRVSISPVSYYKIERGEQEPSAIQLFGICMSLFGEAFPYKVFQACASEEWLEIEKTHEYPDNQLFTPAEYEIPFDWKVENFDAVVEECEEKGKEPPSNVWGAAIRTADVQDVFEVGLPF